MDSYQRVNKRRFPTCREVLHVIKSMGYRKVEPTQELPVFIKGFNQMTKQVEYPFKVSIDLSSMKLVFTMLTPTLANDGTSYLGEVVGNLPLEIAEVLVPKHPEVVKAREEANTRLKNLVSKLKKEINFYEEKCK